MCVSQLIVNSAKKYYNCLVYDHEYDINGKKFCVHSHFVGSKNIDDVIREFRDTQDALEMLKKAIGIPGK